jgi:aspartate ammonia-lyase
MPGKVNPVIPEMTAQVGFQVIGNDTAIAFAAASGECELNVMRPVIIHNLLQSFEILKNALRILRTRCVEGIQADREKCRQHAENSFGIAAALNPYIGYSKAAECVQEALSKKQTLRQVVLSKGLLSEKELARILSPENLTRPSK